MTKGGPNKEDYQDPTNSPELDGVIDNINEGKAADLYDKYNGSEIVLPAKKGEKLMGKVRKCVKYDESSTGER